MPIFWIVYFSPTLYIAYSFSDGTHVERTTGKLGYIQIRNQSNNNLIVDSSDGSRQIGAGSVEPCGALSREQVRKYAGTSVVALYQHNAIYQLNYESNNQLVLPQCTVENNVEKYKNSITMYFSYCITMILFILMFINTINTVIYQPCFVMAKSKMKIFKWMMLYMFLSLVVSLYLQNSLYSLYSFMFALFY